MSSANDRMDNLMRGIQQIENAVKGLQQQIKANTKVLQSEFDYMLGILSDQMNDTAHLQHEVEELKTRNY